MCVDDQLHEFREVQVHSLVCSATSQSSRNEAQAKAGISYTLSVQWEGRVCVAPNWVWKVLLFCYEALPFVVDGSAAEWTVSQLAQVTRFSEKPLLQSATRVESIKASRSIIPKTEIRNALSENVISQPNYAHVQTVRTRPSSAWLRG